MKKIYVLLGMMMIVNVGWGQVSLTNGSPTVTIDFSSSTPPEVGTNPGSAFAGAGFEPDPTTAGRLNSNAWAVTGWSDGALAFGGTRIAVGTDYRRGTTAVSVTIGGIYAFTGAPGSATNPTLMIQPAGSDWAPGTLTLRIQNNGTTNITDLAVSYNIYIRNDQNRSNSFNFSHSSDDITYTLVGALDYTSPAASDALGWVIVGTAPSRSTTITGLNITPGSYYYIRWSGADVSGTGSRDEFGLDDIDITATFAITLPVNLISFSGYREGSRNLLRWTTATESNNHGFEVQRSVDGINYSAIGFVNTQAFGGNSTDQLSYTFTDNAPAGLKQYYRLKQEDWSGTGKLSNIVLIRGSKPFTLSVEAIFPNPARSHVNLVLAAPESDQVTIVLNDALGRTVMQRVVRVEPGSNTIPLDVSTLRSGSYFVRVVCSDGCEATGQLLKQ